MMKKALLSLYIIILLTLITGCASNQYKKERISFNYPGIEYKLEVRKEPRPLRIHILSVSLLNQLYEVDAIIADDPDGTGIAEAKITQPLVLVNNPEIIAAINANAFADYTLKKGQIPVWSENLPVDIKGWALNRNRIASYGEKGYASLWVCHDNQLNIGYLEATKKNECKMAVSGFTPLILNGKMINFPDKSLHPRTAAGLIRAKSKLILVVVDGRQKGYSEGMTLLELAEFMKELGCDNAINLDGGGSSIMIIRDNSGRKIVVNSPCSRPFRPVPVMLAIKKNRD